MTGQFTGQGKATLLLRVLVLLEGHRASYDRNKQQNREPAGQRPESSVGAAGRSQLPGSQGTAGLDEVVLARAEFSGMLVGPLVEGGQPPAAEEIGLVTAPLLPVSGLAVKLCAQPEPGTSPLNRLAQWRPLSQQRLMRYLHRGLSSRIFRVLVAGEQPGVDERIHHHLLIGA